MTSVEKRQRVAELRAQGLKIREIAELTGIPTSTVKQYLSDPDGAKARARKLRYSKPCRQCGAPTNPGGKRPQHKGSGLCAKCNMDALTVATQQTARQRRERIESMWAAGMTSKQIAEAMGRTGGRPESYVAHLRRYGYNLPHRRTPEQIARITAGSNQRLTKARAVVAEQRAARASQT